MFIILFSIQIVPVFRILNFAYCLLSLLASISRSALFVFTFSILNIRIMQPLNNEPVELFIPLMVPSVLCGYEQHRPYFFRNKII